ncbi:hypothetical protein ASG78_12475 [Nostocoides sp. Soil756]|nr:hypothetical protein ASG78_12475 [Tetrasphaera sp. Soil756]
MSARCQVSAESSIERTHWRPSTATRTAPVSVARATAHEATAHARSAESVATVTVRPETRPRMPKSLVSRAASCWGSPAASGSRSAQVRPAWVWPEMTDAVARAFPSCCA